MFGVQPARHFAALTSGVLSMTTSADAGLNTIDCVPTVIASDLPSVGHVYSTSLLSAPRNSCWPVGLANVQTAPVPILSSGLSTRTRPWVSEIDDAIISGCAIFVAPQDALRSGRRWSEFQPASVDGASCPSSVALAGGGVRSSVPLVDFGVETATPFKSQSHISSVPCGTTCEGSGLAVSDWSICDARACSCPKCGGIPTAGAST